MDLQLQGKRALVTGGSRGIGKAIARVLIEEGCEVAISARDPQRLAAASDELGGAAWFAYDAADDASVEAMVTDAAEALGGLDILVNNAASPGSVHGPMKLADLTADHALADLQVKVLGYLRCSRVAAPYMQEQGWGRIVNVSGLAARGSGNTVGSIRNVSVAAMTKNLADELGPDGINVTVVHPGLTRTEATPERIAQIAESNGISLEEAESSDGGRKLGANDYRLRRHRQHRGVPRFAEIDCDYGRHDCGGRRRWQRDPLLVLVAAQA